MQYSKYRAVTCMYFMRLDSNSDGDLRAGGLHLSLMQQRLELLADDESTNLD